MPDGTYTCASCEKLLTDIVAILDHEGCDPMFDAADLSRRERNTIMYVESRVVDNRGILDPEQMDVDDFANLKLFHAARVIEGDTTDRGIEITKFTDQAWTLARDCRKMRADDWIDRDVDLGDVPG